MTDLQPYFRAPRRLLSVCATFPNEVMGVTLKAAAFVAAGILFPAVAYAGDRGVGFELGLGALYAPEYEGSDQYAVKPTGTASLNQLSFGSLNFSRSDERLGFSVGPSFRYLTERNSTDFPILAGIPTNEAALELGLRAGYDWENYAVFGQVRKGITGHHGVAGELGADVKFALSDRTKLSQ